MQDEPGSELFTIQEILDVALGMMAALRVEVKGQLLTQSRRSNTCELRDGRR